MVDRKHRVGQDVVFVTSDLHLGHRKVAQIRNFSSTVGEENRSSLQWNSVVDPRSIVYILGDVSFMNLEQTKEWFKKANGYVKFIKGNHDSSKDLEKIAYEIGGEYLPPIYEISITNLSDEKNDITLCHYPLAAWNKSDYGSINLHGHLHGQESHSVDKYTGAGTRIDIGVDCSEKLGFEPYAPINLCRLIKMTQKHN